MHPGKILFNRIRVKYFWPKIQTKLASFDLLQNCWAELNVFGPKSGKKWLHSICFKIAGQTSIDLKNTFLK